MPATRLALEAMLDESGLSDKAEKVGDAMYRLRWGSATVVVGTSGKAIVVVAPIFKALPEREADRFCRTLLELNAEMGGTAAFALRADGSVVLQCGRGVDGLDASELGLMLGTVGKFADQYDDALASEFYS